VTDHNPISESPAVSERPVAAAEPETFCTYLTKQLVAQRGYAVGAVPETAALAAQADVLLIQSDGYSFSVVALIDREAHPDKAFTLTAKEVDNIAHACLRYGGRIGGAKMPATIRLMEIGPASADQPQRLRPIRQPWYYSKSFKSAWVIDTVRRTVWTTDAFRGRGMRKLIQQLLDSPRQDAIAPSPVVLAPRSFPWLTTAIIAALIAIFTAEVVFAIGGWTDLLQPKLATIYAMGGLTQSLVVISGEWYRLFAAPLLHADAGHVTLNAVALGVAGWTLEPLIGRAWFGAVFVVGALSGALMSLVVNPASLISVGASGAIMALFAAMLIISRHFLPGATRTGLQMNAIYILIPSVLPLISGVSKVKIDYGAHFGGALGGIAIGLLMLALWRRSEPLPRLRAVAVAVCIAALGGIVYAALPLRQNYATYELGAAFAPDALVPQTDDDANTKSADLIARYPRDPRLHYIRAVVLVQANDGPGAEKELRAVLAEEAVWRRAITGGNLSERAHMLLALVLVDASRLDEAKEVARPACGTDKSAPIRKILDEQNLCDN
jgi:rhomboid protease GluP